LSPDEAIRDLLDVSTDITAVAILGPGDEVLAAGPPSAAAGVTLGPASRDLWTAAAAEADSLAGRGLDHVVVQDAAGAVALLAAGERRIVALTGPRPALGLLVFDLRTCLGDAFPAEAGA
jgi:predicted regulator of Ras-like GTPase activity (Roadblock/LC7/MglB family)